MKLNQTTVAEISPPPGQAEAMVFDDDMPGLGLRLRASGARVWVYQYKTGRRSRRVTIGNANVVSLAKARKTAADLHARVRLGGDPAGEKAESRIRAADTMAAALAAFLPYQRARIRPSSFKHVERHLMKRCRPLHTLQLSQIDRRAVATRMTAVATKHGPIEANRVVASLSAFFGWSVREGLIDSNPAAGATRRPEQSRERVISNVELKTIWAATAGDSDYAAIVRLLMLTGCRLAEIGSLRWSEIDGDRILLPASRTKNNKAHVVPLTIAARAIIDARPRRDGRDFVFGRDQGRPFTGWSTSKKLLDKKLGAAVAEWRHHDLRRTAATKMAEMDIAPHIIEALLNHVSGHKAGVAGVYNRARYKSQKVHALNAWAEHLLEIVEGRPATDTVIKLRA